MTPQTAENVVYLLAIADYESSRLDGEYAVRPVAAFTTEHEAEQAKAWASAHRHSSEPTVILVPLHRIT